MTVSTVKYRDWTLEVDVERTKQVYQKVEHGSPEACHCHECKNFAANRERIYPEEIKKLLAELGVDYKKESEVYHVYRMDNGLHHYGGWFHFKGRITEGTDCRIDLPGGGSSFDPKPVTETFAIAFMKGNALNLFEKNEQDKLIQIEFTAYSDWVIDKEFESD